jgi:hypothetical protein
MDVTARGVREAHKRRENFGFTDEDEAGPEVRVCRAVQLPPFAEWLKKIRAPSRGGQLDMGIQKHEP